MAKTALIEKWSKEPKFKVRHYIKNRNLKFVITTAAKSAAAPMLTYVSSVCAVSASVNMPTRAKFPA